MAQEPTNPPDDKLHMVAVMKAIAHRDGQALHALLFDMPGRIAEKIIDGFMAIDARRSIELAPVQRDLDEGEARWRRVIDRWQAREIARYLAEQGGDGTSDQA